MNTMFRYTAGDFITGGLAWTRPVHIAGFQVREDFSMRPDLVTFPMPAIRGSAGVPSTVNVLADGNLVASGSVGAGPFEVPQLPVVTGAGNIAMTVTNALGQQVTLTQPFMQVLRCWRRGCTPLRCKLDGCAATGAWTATITAKSRVLACFEPA